MSLSTATPLTLLVVDDHPVFPDVLAQALEAEPDVKIVATACDTTAAVAAWRRHKPAVTLVDLRVLGADGLRTVQRIRSLDATARVLVFTSADRRQEKAAAIAAGATGCITKAMRYDELLATIRKLHGQSHKPHGNGRRAGRSAVARSTAAPSCNARAGDGRAGPPLTSRELDVLVLLRDGFSQKQISRRMAIAGRTVRVHISAIKEKLAAASTVQCVAKAYELGILRP